MSSPTQPVTLSVQNMTCAACVRRVERTLEKAPGVRAASVSLASQTALIAVDGDPATAAALLTQAGYPARVVPPEERIDPSEEAKKEAARAGQSALAAGLITLPVFAVSMIWHVREEWVNLALLPFATWVIFGAGARFHRGAWKALRAKAATMDTLVSLGTVASWIISLVGMALHEGPHESHHVYLESGAVIVTLILTGRWLESRGKAAMSQAVSLLLQRAPQTARLHSPDGPAMEVPAALVKKGQLLKVLPGEVFPVDGEVVEGQSDADESLVTGEPEPQPKGPGSPVASGSLNGLGPLVIKATAVGEEATLARIISLISKAQASKAPLQRLADRVASVFVPVVVCIALLASLFAASQGSGWEAALLRGVSVLVIACPCALGLATPMALIAGTGRGAKEGILTRDAESLERAAGVRWIILDKTGTLTLGRPGITKINLAPGVTEAEALSLAASLESGSEHPLARAILEKAAGLPLLPLNSITAQPGRGIEGTLDGEAIKLGAPEWALGASAEPEGAAATLAVLTKDGALLASFEYEDQLRPEAPEAVAKLRSLGLEPFLASGDRSPAVESAALRTGITRQRSRMTPEDKARLVEELQREAPAAMVGDGLNDAPALALAELGVAMGQGADAAKESAGLTLMRSDLRLLPKAVLLARKTVSTIRWNLAWAFGYNVLMIPLAFAGFLNPMFASGAMAFSSLSVALNSLRLRNCSLDD